MIASLTVLGSGSKGNATAIEADGAVLLLDAGFSTREIERRAEVAGVDLAKLCGIALTHEHGDHAQGAIRLARQRRVPVVASPGTWHALNASSGVRHIPVAGGGRSECGPFLLSGCVLLHDAAEPLALTVSLPEGPRIGVAYDFGRATQSLRYHFRDLDAIVLEANYDEVMLRTGGYPASVQERIAGSGGHLSNRATAQLLAELFHPALGTVVLAHLSQRCNTPDAARREVGRALAGLGFSGELAVAGQEAPVGPLRVSRRERVAPPPSLFDEEEAGRPG